MLFYKILEIHLNQLSHLKKKITLELTFNLSKAGRTTLRQRVSPTTATRARESYSKNRNKAVGSIYRLFEEDH